MPPFKDQHFVPKSFFKLFSRDKIYIGMYNLKKQNSSSVPLSTQCQKGYFYSQNPEQEKSFKEIEDITLAILKEINVKKSINNQSEENNEFLRLFVLFQRGRTQSAKLHAEQASNHFAREYLKSQMKIDPNFPAALTIEKLNSVKIIDKNAFNKTLLLHINAAILLRDLDLVLLKNETNKDFIFSDNPVVFYNEYLRRIKGKRSLGFQSPGLQIFCPISPKLCLFFYDPQTYIFRFKIFEKSLSIYKKTDIEAINKLQFFNCNKNIYFRDIDEAHYIKQMHAEINFQGGQLRKIISEEEIFFDEVKNKFVSRKALSEEMPDYQLDLDYIKTMPIFKNLPRGRSPVLYEPYMKTMREIWDQMDKSIRIED